MLYRLRDPVNRLRDYGDSDLHRTLFGGLVSNIEKRLKQIDANLDLAAHRIGELLIENHRLKELVKRGVEEGRLCGCTAICGGDCEWSRDIKQAAGIPT